MRDKTKAMSIGKAKVEELKDQKVELSHLGNHLDIRDERQDQNFSWGVVLFPDFIGLNLKDSIIST